MRFKEGASVFTSDDQEVGRVDRVVIDPKTNEITHIVVRKGFLFTEDKVVPIRWVSVAQEDRVILREDVEDLEQLPKFEDAYYVPATEKMKPPYKEGFAPQVYWYPPPGMVTSGYTADVAYPALSGYQEPTYVAAIGEPIPEGTVPLKEGAQVLINTGEKVGDVEQVFAEPEENRATHLLISQGLLFEEKKLVPIGWVANVEEDQVHLAVGERLLGSLPEYQPED